MRRTLVGDGREGRCVASCCSRDLTDDVSRGCDDVEGVVNEETRN